MIWLGGNGVMAGNMENWHSLLVISGGGGRGQSGQTIRSSVSFTVLKIFSENGYILA